MSGVDRALAATTCVLLALLLAVAAVVPTGAALGASTGASATWRTAPAPVVPDVPDKPLYLAGAVSAGGAAVDPQTGATGWTPEAGVVEFASAGSHVVTAGSGGLRVRTAQGAVVAELGGAHRAVTAEGRDRVIAIDAAGVARRHAIPSLAVMATLPNTDLLDVTVLADGRIATTRVQGQARLELHDPATLAVGATINNLPGGGTPAPLVTRGDGVVIARGNTLISVSPSLQVVTTFSLPGTVTGLASTPSGDVIAASATQVRRLSGASLQGGWQVALPQTAPVTSVAVTAADEVLVASASAFGSRAGSEIPVLDGASGAVRRLLHTPAPTRVVGSHGGAVRPPTTSVIGRTVDADAPTAGVANVSLRHASIPPGSASWFEVAGTSNGSGSYQVAVTSGLPHQVDAVPPAAPFQPASATNPGPTASFDVPLTVATAPVSGLVQGRPAVLLAPRPLSGTRVDVVRQPTPGGPYAGLPAAVVASTTTGADGRYALTTRQTVAAGYTYTLRYTFPCVAGASERSGVQVPPGGRVDNDVQATGVCLNLG